MRRAVIALAVSLMLAVPIGAQTYATSAAGNAAVWLRAQQLPDGGFPGFAEETSSRGVSIFAALALLSAGIKPGDVTRGGASLLDYLHATAGAIKPDPSKDTGASGYAADYAFVAAMAGEDPGAFGGVDLLALSTVEKNPSTGVYSGRFEDHARVVLAFALARSPEVARQVDGGLLLRGQNADGGWPDYSTGKSMVMPTALVIQALVASGQGGDATTRGMAWLAGAVGKKGDVAGFWGLDPTDNWGDVPTTAAVIEAMVAVQADPAGITQAQAALATCQNGDGSFTGAKILPGAQDILATTWAIMALNGRSLVALVPA